MVKKIINNLTIFILSSISIMGYGNEFFDSRAVQCETAFNFLCEEDYERAFNEFKKSAEDSILIARLFLIYLYQEGIGTEIDIQEAERLMMIVSSEMKTKSDREKIDEFRLDFEWIKQIAKDKLCEGSILGAIYNNLGYLYLRGWGTEKNTKKAFKYLKKAVELGNILAHVDLAKMYQEGLATKQDYQMAYYLYKIAAEKGNSIANYRLKITEKEGLGMLEKKALVVAFDWGKVLVKANYGNLHEFIKNSFSIDSVELNNVLVNIRKSRDLDMKERDFWIDYSKEKNIQLPLDWFDTLENVKLSCLQLNPEMFEIAKKLKQQGIKVVVFSNVSKEKAQLLRRVGYYDIFDDLILSCDIGFEKPHPEAYDILLSKLNVDPKQVIFVDDKINNIKAAKEKGINGIVFETPDEFKTELEKYNFIIKKDPRN